MSQDLFTPSFAFIFHQDLVLIKGKSGHCAKASSERSEICSSESMCENDVSWSLNHSHNLNPMNPGIVILTYVHDISKEKKSIDGRTW